MICPDTNVLLRFIVRDDEAQARIADGILSSENAIAISVTSLCEIVWVLRGVYRSKRAEIETVLRSFLDSQNVTLDRAAVEAGLAAHQAGADFADGVIAYEGRWLGAIEFVSFDRKAASQLREQGVAARCLLQQ